MPARRTRADGRHQQPFSCVAPVLGAALLLGAGGGFVLATILTLSQALRLVSGSWWLAVVQAHGHLQLYGWAGLFVLGVALHFLPRLRGSPLVFPQLVPWMLGLLVAALGLRAVSQPLVTLSGAGVWRVGLVASGALEVGGIGVTAMMLSATARAGDPLSSRAALWSIFPFLVCAFSALCAASVVNLMNVIQAAAVPAGLVAPTGDDLNVLLGLLGFLVPMALAMSARSLPMYAGLDAFPRRVLWPLAWGYLGGLALLIVGTSRGIRAAIWSNALTGLGMCLIGGALIAFVAIFLWMMRWRGRLSEQVSRLAPSPAVAAQAYQARVVDERTTLGPFVGLIGSAYLWAVLGGILLIADGVPLLFATQWPFPLDAIRHSLALGFVALLLCGVAPRMIPGFSGGWIISSRLVQATLWLGNAAALLRVGSVLLAPTLAMLGTVGATLHALAFGLSGPLGLALAICLVVNLWPALWPAAGMGQ